MDSISSWRSSSSHVAIHELALPRSLDLAHLYDGARREFGDLVRNFEDELQIYSGEEYVRFFL